MRSVKRRNIERQYDKEKQKIITISMKELNKQKVLEFITQHIRGVYPLQIKEEAGITPEPTRQTIHNYLRELVSEKKIRKDKKSRCYFMSDSEPGIIHIFSQSMNNASHAILDKVHNPSLPDPRNHPDPSFVELSKAISGNAVSEEYCRTKFDANSSSERYFFEFTNRIGHISSLFL